MDQGKFEQIESYLMKNMAPDEKAEFERQMANDAELRNEVERQRENMLAVEFGAFSGSVTRVAKQYQQENPSIGPTRSKGHYWAIAAGFAALLAVTIWAVTGSNRSESLMAEYYQPDLGLPVVMGVIDDPVFADAMVDYKVGEYDEAIGKWSTISQDVQNDTLSYYLASAYLANGQPIKAIPLFKQTLDQPGSAFEHQAAWYLLLSRVSLEQWRAAKAIYIDQNSPYSQQARELRAKLD